MMSHKQSIVSRPLLLPDCPARNSNVINRFWRKNRKFCLFIKPGSILPYWTHCIMRCCCLQVLWLCNVLGATSFTQNITSCVIRRMSSKIHERQRARRFPLKTWRVIESRPRAVQDVDRTKPRRRYCYRPGGHGHPNARSHAWTG